MRAILLFLVSINLAFSAETGIASHYSVRTNGGTRTASGEKLSDKAMTVAHKTHAFGTVLKVTCLKTGKSVVAKVNDRGPYIRGRIVDLSQAAAKELGIIKRGIAKVRVEVVKQAPKKHGKRN